MNKLLWGSGKKERMNPPITPTQPNFIQQGIQSGVDAAKDQYRQEIANVVNNELTSNGVHSVLFGKPKTTILSSQPDSNQLNQNNQPKEKTHRLALTIIKKFGNALINEIAKTKKPKYGSLNSSSNILISRSSDEDVIDGEWHAD